MKNYLKLHRLAFRRKIAHAAFLVADDELRQRETTLRQLQQTRAGIPKGYRHADPRDHRGADTTAGEAADAKIEAAIERAIAVRDIAAEEKQRTQETSTAATAAYHRVLRYLEDNSQLIPEGIPNGI